MLWKRSRRSLLNKNALPFGNATVYYEKMFVCSFFYIVFSHNYMYITIYQKIQGLELIWIDVSFGFIWGFVSELEKVSVGDQRSPINCWVMWWIRAFNNPWVSGLKMGVSKNGRTMKDLFSDTPIVYEFWYMLYI